MEETIEIKQVHDNDKFIVKRTIVEELNLETINKVYAEIEKGLKETNQQIADVEPSAKKRTEFLTKQRDTLQERLEAFGQFATKKDTNEAKVNKDSPILNEVENDNFEIEADKIVNEEDD